MVYDSSLFPYQSTLVLGIGHFHKCRTVSGSTSLIRYIQFIQYISAFWDFSKIKQQKLFMEIESTFGTDKEQLIHLALPIWKRIYLPNIHKGNRHIARWVDGVSIGISIFCITFSSFLLPQTPRIILRLCQISLCLVIWLLYSHFTKKEHFQLLYKE